MAQQQKPRTVAILQSNYIPWKGYFDIIRQCDEFVIFDEVQYTRRDWRNRNRIKTAHGLQWLTIPVSVKGKYDQSIAETQVVDTAWRAKHWKAIDLNYRNSPCYDQFADRIRSIYETCDSTYLSRINLHFIKEINALLDIKTRISSSFDYASAAGKNERLIAICKGAGADVYLSGPAGRCYIDEQQFADHGLSVRWADYSDYPQYRQLFEGFEHNVSIIDLILNTGLNALSYMKCNPRGARDDG